MSILKSKTKRKNFIKEGARLSSRIFVLEVLFLQMELVIPGLKIVDIECRAPLPGYQDFLLHVKLYNGSLEKYQIQWLTTWGSLYLYNVGAVGVPSFIGDVIGRFNCAH